MRAFVFEDTTIELSTQDDCFLTEIAHLILEFSINGTTVGKVNLLSRISTSGIWDTNETPCFGDAALIEELTISVWMELAENERQLLGFMELSGRVLRDKSGHQYEVPLIRHEDYPGLILKTRVKEIHMIQESRSGIPPEYNPAYRETVTGKMVQDALAAKEDFERNGNMATLEQAILQFEHAVKIFHKGAPALPWVLGDLAWCLFHRFTHLGSLNALNDAISRFEEANKLIPDSHPCKCGFLSDLGSALSTRFRRLGNLADINDAISRHQAAVDLTPDSSLVKPSLLNHLGISLKDRFDRSENLADINNAISLQREALDLISNGDPAHLPTCLYNLGDSLETRFLRLGDIADLNEAISRQRAAINLIPDGHLSKATYLSGLANILETRFRRLGRLADIDDAISLEQAATNLTPDSHPEKPGRLNNLGIYHRSRFGRLGNLADIDSAISREQAALDLTPDDHPKKSHILNNISISFQARFRRFENRADIDNAISYQRAAVNLLIDGHPNMPTHLSTLGSLLETRFQRFDSLTDLNEAVSLQQAAVNLVPYDHSDKHALLSNLGHSLRARFILLGNLTDLNDAISHDQAAISLVPDDHPSKPGLLNSLGTDFSTRFKWYGDISDISNAILQHQAAVNLASGNHHDEALCRLNLSESLLSRFHISRHYDDAEAAISCSAAATVSSTMIPANRFAAAQTWISAASLVNHHSLLSAYECAIDLIPVVAWLGLPIAGRHQYLTKIGGIVRDAAAAAISAEQYDKALEWLEQGRSIVWTQILQLRTPVDQLHDVNPDLAGRLLYISRHLDQWSRINRDIEGNARSMEEEGQQYRALTTERESIIEQIRSLPNFENFLKPPKSSDLMKAAQHGPVVVLNIAKSCDALAIIPGFDEVVHIPLPSITFDRVIGLRDELNDLLCSNGVRMRGERAAQRVTDDSTEYDCRHILEELWSGLVKPVMDSLAFSPHPDTLPRIWWCVTGPLAFLPIHAAGIYNPASLDEQLSNYVISSYTPTLSALLEPVISSTESPFSFLSVIQPSAPGASSILSTLEELDRIRNRLSNRAHVVIEGREGTKSRVIKEMEGCNWVHLACHGVQRPDEPTKSALILEDGHLTLDEIIKLDLPKAEFAFLSACQTTTGDEKLSEEAVHIAGGMLLAGYRGVVATMWSIKDELAPEVTDEFYAHIMRDTERPDSRNAAEALHFAVQKVRRKAGVSLTDWIPFVHLGV